MEIVEPRDFLAGGAFREKDFREAIRKVDWAAYQDKPVLIQGCSSITLPTWAFLVITASLAPYARSISFGEIKNPIPVSGKPGVPIGS
ncbi:MAG: hypothetical protein A2992_04705 [Elusimicrobia bacterium RIFCSPLOWO2_01_FULL_59_12]|nr:MAG: hypothetical protein A2992_04705 [Elusimicrobia bacterium RIFCSPLOWO2_01_FULL_59_12]